MKNYRLNKIQSVINNRSLLTPLDILLVGGTGTGKSSTLNALFSSNIVKVGTGVDPETQEISSHRLNDYIRFHDSAGLGDGKEADHKHSKNITSELLSTCNDGNDGFIDLAMVILDGGSRDLGTAFHLLESVVLTSIESERVVVGINQADMAMKGRHWNSSFNHPEPLLIEYLEEKSYSVSKRIKESTGLTIKKPVYYSAEFNYNIDILMDHFIEHIPSSRRTLDF